MAKHFIKEYIENQPLLIPENDHEELWHMSGRVEALHDYCRELATIRANSSYASDPLDENMRMVCAIMGFADALAIKMTPKGEPKGEQENDTV